MKRLAILTIVLISFISISFAKNKNDKKELVKTSETINQTTISGTILDQTTGEALVGVKVELEGADKVVYTDFDGNFSFKAVKRGTYSLITNYISYKNSVHSNINTDFNSPINIKLTGL